jgi:pyruvate formate lyase activating enzyme
VLTFARRLADRKKVIWVRFVLVPGLTDNFEDIAHIADFSAELCSVQRVDVLPFHQLGRYKWKALGLKYELDAAAPPNQDLVNRVCECFQQRGLAVV